MLFVKMTCIGSNDRSLELDSAWIEKTTTELANYPFWKYVFGALDRWITTGNSSGWLDHYWTILQDKFRSIFHYEDRTSRFFPPAPRIPRISGVGDPGSMENNEDSNQELLNFSLQRFNILCSGDKDGCVCFSIFGIFPIGCIVRYNHCTFFWKSLSSFSFNFHLYTLLACSCGPSVCLLLYRPLIFSYSHLLDALFQCMMQF